MQNNSLAIPLAAHFREIAGHRGWIGRRTNDDRLEGENFWKIEIFQVEPNRASQEILGENVGRSRNMPEYLARVYALRRWRHNRFTYSAEKGGTVVLR